MKRFLLPAILAATGALAGTNEPLIIAHRGASGYLPEHTLPAKALAYGMGADYLEQDLVLSRDGVPVVLHDIQIDAVTDVAKRFPDRKRDDGRYYAIDFTLTELRQLAVTERISLKTGAPVFRGRFPANQSAFTIATLEEELQFIGGLNRSTGRAVGIYPEIKQPGWHRRQGQDLSAMVLPVLARHGYRTRADRCFVQCFDLDELKRIRNELGFQGRLIYLCGSAPTNLSEVAVIADGIGPAISAIVKPDAGGRPQISDLVERAHAIKLLVHPYTVRADELPKWVNSVDELFELLFVQAHCDGVFTDFPDLGAAFVRSRAWTQ